MKAARPVAVLVGLIPIALLAPLAHAFSQEKADRPKTLILFDGKSLDGWKRTGFGGSGEVTVEEGSLVMKAGRSMTGVTSTRDDLPTKDYELTYEARRLDGDDFFAAATFPVTDSHVTLVNGGWGGGVTGLSSIDGVDASENETNRSIHYVNKTWYRFRVRVTARAIRCWVDDKEVVTLRTVDRRVGTRIESRPSRPLGFATWKTTGAVRKVELRPLSPSEIAATDKIDD